MSDQAMPISNPAADSLRNSAPATAMDPMAARPMGSDLLKNIVALETGEKEKAILGEAPELDMSLLEAMGPAKSIRLVVLKILFGALICVSLLALAFFTSQFTNKFDFITAKFKLPNVSADLASTNAEIIALQTDLNFELIQEIKIALDKFSYDSDQFIREYENSISTTIPDEEKRNAVEAMVEIRSGLKEPFLAARDKISKNFTTFLVDKNFATDSQLQTLYEEKLRALINDKLQNLSKGTAESTKRDLRNYQQTLKLINNAELKNLLIQTDFDALKDEDLYKSINKINALTVNDATAMQAIKAKRIKWSDVIKEIDLRTAAVDKNFNENFYNSVGGIRYNSYDFDSSTGKISIAGETKSLDPTNFTMIANLIEELNQSKVFANGEMRSFSKSGSIEEGYLATLRLALDLKNNPNLPKTP